MRGALVHVHMRSFDRSGSILGHFFAILTLGILYCTSANFPSCRVWPDVPRGLSGPVLHALPAGTAPRLHGPRGSPPRAGFGVPPCSRGLCFLFYPLTRFTGPALVTPSPLSPPQTTRGCRGVCGGVALSPRVFPTCPWAPPAVLAMGLSARCCPAAGGVWVSPREVRAWTCDGLPCALFFGPPWGRRPCLHSVGRDLTSGCGGDGLGENPGVRAQALCCWRTHLSLVSAARRECRCSGSPGSSPRDTAVPGCLSSQRNVHEGPSRAWQLHFALRAGEGLRPAWWL